MPAVRKPKRGEYEGGDTSVDDNRVIVTGENQFARLSEKDGAEHSTEASFWRIVLSPAGPGHVLYLKSELTRDRWAIYADNIALARWLQHTVQGMLVDALKDMAVPVVEAAFSRAGDPRSFWTETIVAADTRVTLTLSEFGDPILVHTKPSNAQPNPRRYGVCTVLVPALEARVTVDGAQARGRAWPRDRLGRPYSTSGLGLSESWTEAR
ncbi:MAG TPA: hypothetical protein VG894_00530 [Bauldia sp.]|nr:hypothetical protein [Bauldia sp.]